MEEFGPEQVKAELLSKAIEGMKAVDAALQAGVIECSVFGQTVVDIAVWQERDRAYVQMKFE